MAESRNRASVVVSASTREDLVWGLRQAEQFIQTDIRTIESSDGEAEPYLRVWSNWRSHTGKKKVFCQRCKGSEWDEDDERRWQEGTIACSNFSSCPYSVEHLMKGDGGKR